MELFAGPAAMMLKAIRMASSKHVLIVDEDRETRTALAGSLEQHGYRVTTASSGG